MTSETRIHDHDDTSISYEQNNDSGEGEGEGEPVGADLEKQTTTGSAVSGLAQRTQSVISRIRSREPGQVARFTHPLTHTKTSPDVVVDFEGPDDPYRPLNWGFRKKAVTTVLYGLTTMGKLPVFLTSVQSSSKTISSKTIVANYGRLQVPHGQARCTIPR
jgi:hypothetical protein